VTILTAVLAGSLATGASGADARDGTAVAPDSGRWRLQASEARGEEHLGRPSLRLKGGTAVVESVSLLDGWIEFDVSFSPERGFVGGIWRVADEENHELFYLRPHQSGNPDASQYTPVFHGVWGWQLYLAPRYAVPVEHRFGEWMRVRIVFAGRRAAIYVDDLETPVLVVDDLKREPAAGAVGLSAGSFAPAWLSRFAYGEGGGPIPAASGEPAPISPLDSERGTIGAWRVSDAFAESDLDGVVELGAGQLDGRTWTTLQAEPGGLADLARVQGLGAGRSTAFAAATLTSDRARTAALVFGFSDRVRVYLNGRLLFRGDDGYTTRDYRFLGSIGYFDTLYLPLEEGDNELVLAVSESFGGWGVQARLEDPDGVAVPGGSGEPRPNH
jgi:hypothetical protein